MIKNTAIIILIILTVLAEVSLIWSLPYPLNLFFLPLLILLFLILFEKRNYSWLFIFTAGFLMDIFTLKPLGTNILILAILYLVGAFLFYNYLTNRSFMSTALLGLIMIVIFELINYFINLYNFGVGLLNFKEAGILFYSILINLCAVVIIYWGVRMTVRALKLSPGFYEKI